MKKTNNTLHTVFYASTAISLIMVILFECNITESGIFAAYGKSEFITATTMELITICAIPLVLRTFKYGFVKRSVCRNGEASLRSWSITRMAVLCLLMVVNTLLYYMFMNVAFGYMGIISFLCIFFVFPSMERLKKEMEECNR